MPPWKVCFLLLLLLVGLVPLLLISRGHLESSSEPAELPSAVRSALQTGAAASAASPAPYFSEGGGPGWDPPQARPPAAQSTESPDLRKQRARPPPSRSLHPEYRNLIREYCFQPVRTERNQPVNIILVRAPFQSRRQEEMYHRYKDEILFLGFSSFEDYPQVSVNPYSGKWSPADKYLGLFPGFLHMMRDPSAFPSHVKLLLLSQSDFALPGPQLACGLGNWVPGCKDAKSPKKYTFTYSGSDQDVQSDCQGWASFAKNWTFLKEAMEVMCTEYDITGVLVATKDKQDRRACSIPKACEGKMVQTKFLDQNAFFDYVKQSDFLIVPQVHDASPRVSTQALALGVPLLMNYHISGGWKYINEKTGEFFHDMKDFRPALERILAKSKAGQYDPEGWVHENAGDRVAGARLKDFVQEHFADRVWLPPGTRILFPAGA